MSTLVQFNYMLFSEINASAGTIPWFDALMVFVPTRSFFAVIGMLLFTFLPVWLSKRRGTTNVEQLSQGASQRKLVLLLIVAFVIGCSIGFARIYVGVHYPDDILGGAIDGLLAALLVTVLRRWLWRPTNAVLCFAHSLRVA